MRVNVHDTRVTWMVLAITTTVLRTYIHTYMSANITDRQTYVCTYIIHSCILADVRTYVCMYSRVHVECEAVRADRVSGRCCAVTGGSDLFPHVI